MSLIFLPLSWTEFFHDIVSFFLWHISVHRANSEIRFSHFFREPVYLALGIAKYYGLCYRQGVVEIAERVELPFFAFNGNEELFYSFERQLVTEERKRNYS